MKGGGPKKILVRLTQADHAVFIAKDEDDESAATPITAPDLDDAAIVLKTDVSKDIIVESTGITYDDNGVLAVEYSQTNAEDEVWDFIEIAAAKIAAAGGGNTEELTGEEGTVIGGTSTAGNPVYLLIDIGPANTAGTTRLSEMAVVGVKKTSGSRSYGAGKFTKPTISLAGVKCNKVGGFVIPQSIFTAAGFGTITAAKRTIPYNGYCKTSNLLLA